jgi:hypothetical protein
MYMIKRKKERNKGRNKYYSLGEDGIDVVKPMPVPLTLNP